MGNRHTMRLEKAFLIRHNYEFFKFLANFEQLKLKCLIAGSKKGEGYGTSVDVDLSVPGGKKKLRHLFALSSIRLFGNKN